jgi:hypothetical protein
MEAGWLSQSFTPPIGITKVDEKTVPKVILGWRVGTAGMCRGGMGAPNAC